MRISVLASLAFWPAILIFSGTAWSDTAGGLEAFKRKDYERAYQEWKAAAETGDAEAQFDLGLLYAQGFGVRRNLSEAERWYRMSAATGKCRSSVRARAALLSRLGQSARRSGCHPLAANGQRRGFRRASDRLDTARGIWHQSRSEAGRVLASTGRRKRPPGRGI